MGKHVNMSDAIDTKTAKMTVLSQGSDEMHTS
jgi:hypothetical protein